MQQTLTFGLMPSGQQMIVGIIHQQMRVTLVHCQGFVQLAVYLYALALQAESSYSHSHDQDGKAKHVTKENNQNPSRHGKTTQQTSNV